MSDEHNGTTRPDAPEPADAPRSAGAPRRQVGRRPEDGEGELGGSAPAADRAVAVADHHDEVDPREIDFAEKQVTALFVIGILAILGFLVAYFAIPIHENLGQYSNFALGGTLAVALLAMGGGFIVWAKKLLPHVVTVQERHDFFSPAEDQEASEETLLEGFEDMGLRKHKMLRRTVIGALALFPLPLIVMVRDFGPLPRTTLLKTGWRAGVRLVDLDTRLPVKLGDLEIGGIQTVMPEGFTNVNDFALAPTILIRFGPGEIESTKERNWGVENHVAYSKICTHAGCPISLYEQQTHHLLCPCHQSTFDMARDAKVIFGPAARPLPQLEIGVDANGYFYAKGPYSEAVGPSFWERR
jgi:ubiquinol-cytochrome c reductase iron-sulfur subunit